MSVHSPRRTSSQSDRGYCTNAPLGAREILEHHYLGVGAAERVIRKVRFSDEEIARNREILERVGHHDTTKNTNANRVTTMVMSFILRSQVGALEDIDRERAAQKLGPRPIAMPLALGSGLVVRLRALLASQAAVRCAYVTG